MKYHVNPKTGQVSGCRAQVKCRFGGASGNENHFGSKEQAEKAAETMLAAQHPQASVKKKPSAFDLTKANVQKGLIDSGIIPNASALPPVSNKSEMIDKWFGGDKTKYDLIVRISDPKSAIRSETKKSVGKLMSAGMGVGMAKESSFDRAPSALLSEVELIDSMEDLPSNGKISLEDLKSGRLKAF